MIRAAHGVILILIAAFTILLISGCEEPESPLEKAGGIEKIVFVSSEYDSTLVESLPSGQIYIMDPNGENKKCLTEDKGHLYPKFLPDGSKIVFQSIRRHETGGPVFDIFIMDIDGNNQVSLTKGLGGKHPIVSPDGSKIAFSSFRDLSEDVYIMDVDGNNQTRLTSYPGWETPIQFSPDGSKILFWCEDGIDREIYIMNIDGSKQAQLTDNPGKADLASFSPDGSQVVFVAEAIYIVNIDGSNLKALTSAGYYYSLSFSPDGLKILFGGRIEGSSSIYGEIYTMDVNSRNITRLTHNLEWDGPGQFSPDGLKIVFSSYRDENNEIYIMDADGMNQKNLTNRPEVDESPEIYPLR